MVIKAKFRNPQGDVYFEFEKRPYKHQNKSQFILTGRAVTRSPLERPRFKSKAVLSTASFEISVKGAVLSVGAIKRR